MQRRRRSICFTLEGWNHLRQPTEGLLSKRPWNRELRCPRYFEPDQLVPWWEAVHSPENGPQYPSREVLRDYLVLPLLTGLRRSEALGLPWMNVNRSAVRSAQSRPRTAQIMSCQWAAIFGSSCVSGELLRRSHGHLRIH